MNVDWVVKFRKKITILAGLGALEPVDVDQDDAIDIDSEHVVKGSVICNCPKDCDVIEYSTEITSASMNINSELLDRLFRHVPEWEKLELDARLAWMQGRTEDSKRAYAKLNNFKTSTSLVHIYFKRLGIVKYIKDERYGTMDVICKMSGSYAHKQS